QGRRLLVSAVVFAVPAWFNTGARFLIPSAPFLALAMGLGIANSPMTNSPGILLAIALFHSVVSWPRVVSTYCDPWAWRVVSIPVKAALRKQPEGTYLRSHIGDLRVPIERLVPPGEKIFS